MHYARGVSGVESGGDLGQHAHRLCCREPVGPQSLSEGGPPHQLHREKEAAVYFAEVVNRNDVRVVKRSDIPALTPKPIPKPVIVSDPRRQDLQSDFPAERHLLGPVNVGHPTVADYTTDAIAAELVSRRQNRPRRSHLRD